MSSFHLRFVGAGEQAGTANECGVCGEVTNGRVLRCQQAGFTLDSNRCDLHRNRDHPYLSQRVIVMKARPGAIKEIVDIDLPFPRDIASKEFNDVRSRLLHMLMDDEQTVH